MSFCTLCQKEIIEGEVTRGLFGRRYHKVCLDEAEYLAKNYFREG